MRTLVVGTIFDGLGGGSDVNFEILKVLPKIGMDVTLQVPTFYLHRSVYAYLSGSSKRPIENPLDRIDSVIQSGVHVPDYVQKELRKLLDDYSKRIPGYNDIASFSAVFRTLRMDRKNSYTLRSTDKYDYVLAMNEIYPVFKCAIDAARIAPALKCVVMLHTEPYRNKYQSASGTSVDSILGKLRNAISRNSWKNALNHNLIIGFTAPSLSPLINSGLDTEIRRKDIPLYIPDPPWCLSSVFYESRMLKDKKGVIFISRLVQDKGLLEIPSIVSRLPEKRIIVLGEFTREEDRVEFFKLADEYSISVDYLGFLNHQDLAPILAKHKVLLYPSHADAFPLTVAQAIATGTSVVAYDIPAIKMNYSGLDSVSIVKEWDKDAMASEINNILDMSDDEYAQMHNSNTESEFIQKFKDCDKIWRGYAEWINDLMKYMEEMCKSLNGEGRKL